MLWPDIRKFDPKAIHYNDLSNINCENYSIGFAMASLEATLRDFQSRDLTYVFIPLTAILFRVTLDSPHSRLPTAHIYGAVLGITL